MWAVQGFLVLGIAFMGLVLVLNHDEMLQEIGATMIVWFTISVQMGLLIGIQLRQQWARWLTAALYGLSLVANVIAFSGNSGSHFAGNIVGALLGLVMLVRFTFGQPARRYFGREMVPG